MAGAYDSAGQTSSATIQVTSLSWTHTPSGVPTAVKVSLAMDADPGAFTVKTYGGQALVAVAGSPRVLAVGRIYSFTILVPPSGAQTVQFNWTNAVRAAGGSVAVTGGTRLGTPGDAAAATIALSTPDPSVIVDAFITQSPSSLTVGADQTERVAQTFGTTNQRRLRMSTQLGSADDVMSWSTDGINNGIIAIPFELTPGAGPAWFL